MADQTSRLSVVIDPKNAETAIQRLRESLKGLGREGLNLGTALQKMSSENHFKGLNQNINSTQNSLNAFSKTVTNSAAALNNFNIATGNVRATSAGIANSLNSAQAALARFGSSGNNVSASLNGIFASANAAQSKLLGIVTSANSAKASLDGLNNAAKSVATNLNNAQAAMARFNQSSQTVVTALNAINSVNSANSVHGLDNAVKQLNPNVVALNSELKKANTTLNSFATFANKAETAATKLNTALISNRTNMTGFASSTNGVGTALQRIGQSTASLQSQITGMGASIAALNRNLQTLNSSSSTASHGINSIQSSMTATTTTANTLHGTFSRLQGLLAGGIAGISALSIAKTADEMQNLDSQVKLVTKSEAQYQAVREKVRGIADNNYSSIAATTNLYQNSARAMTNMGKSQQQVLEFTNAITLAMRTGGKGANEQKAALLQLGQALQSGVLQGDEFRSLAENAPILLDLVAEKLHKTRGEVRAMSSDGKITAAVVVDAVTGATSKLEEMAGKMPVTMSQAFQVAKNKYDEFIGDTMNGTDGWSSKIAGLILSVSKNFDDLAKGAVLGVGLAFVQFASKVDVGALAMKAFNTVMAANPFVLVATAIIGVGTAIYGVNDVMETLKIVTTDVIDVIKQGYTELGQLVGSISNDIFNYINDSNTKSNNSFTDMFGKSENGFTGMLQTIARVMTMATATIGGFLTWAGTGFLNLGKGIANAFIWAGNTVQDILDSVGKGVTEAIDWSINGINGIIGRANSVLEQTPLTLRIKTVEGISPFVSKRTPTPYLEYGNMNVSDHIGGKIADWMPKVDGYFQGITQHRESAANDAAADKSRAGLMGDLTTAMGKNTAAVNNNTDESKKGKKATDLLHGDIAKAIQWGANKLGVNPNDLAAAISFETGGTFSPAAKNPKSSGTGLIQFMQYTDGTGDKYTPRSKWDYYGMSRDKFGSLKPTDQMQYVVKYLQERGIGKGSGLGAIYDAIAGTPKNGYRSGTEAYKSNRVWDADGDGIVRRGEAVTSKNFKKHIKNYFPNGVNLLEVGEGETDFAKDLVKQQEKNLELQIKYGNKEIEVKAKVKKAIDEINESTLTPELEKEKMRVKARADGDRELAEYKKRLQDQLDELSKYKASELSIINKARTDAYFDAEEKFKNDPEGLKLAKVKIDEKWRYDIDQYQAKMQKQRNELFSFQKTEREVMADGWVARIAEAKNKHTELGDMEAEALEEQSKKALAVYDLEQSQKLLDLKKFNMTDMQYFEESLRIKQELVDKSNLSPEMKSAQKAQNEYDNRKSILGVFKNQPENLDRPMFFGKGAKGQFEEAIFNNAEIQRIYNEGYTALEASGQLHSQKMTDFQRAYQEAVRASNEEIMQSERGMFDERMGMYDQILSMAGGVWDTMTDMVKKSFGEQSAAARGFFFVQKSIAIAQAMINTEQAATKALADGGAVMGIPMASMVRGLGYASIGLMASQALAGLAGKGFATGGYTGNMATNQVAGVVHGKEYVVNAANTAKYRDKLESMNRGTYKEGSSNNVIINNYSSEKASVQEMPNGDMLVTIGKMMSNIADAKIADNNRKQLRQGGVNYRG